MTTVTTDSDYDYEGPELAGQREKVYLDRYAQRDRDGQLVEHSIVETWRRVATAIAQAEEAPYRDFWTDEFFSAMSDFKFVPGGRILAGAGTAHQVTFANCYVLPKPEDSRNGIIESLKAMTEIMARGGGVGINLSSLRPRGSYIRTVNGTASGPVSWAELYSVATGDVISQGGSRRGALLVLLECDHPDIEEFITVKRTEGRMRYANLSVGVSTAFMEAVKADADWHLRWQGEVLKTVRARDLWRLIAQSAWESGEPGLIFLDRVNEMNNVGYIPEEEIVSTNPCGELPLPAYGVCNLGSINLSTFVRPDVIPGQPQASIDWDALEYHVTVAVRFLDNVIDLNYSFLGENDVVQRRTRRVGIGTMGLADTLIKLGLRYGSKESLAFIKRLYAFIRDAAYEASARLAQERGAFPTFDAAAYLSRPFIQKLPEKLRDMIAEDGIRNASLLCQAPTGTTSLIAGASSGIEPIFSFVTRRKDRTGEHIMRHPLYQGWVDEHGEHAPLPDYFVSAMELTPEEHVWVQATIQELVDSSISKTCNAPHDHAVEDVERLYTLAYDLGCKGITYFRDGCREGVLEAVGSRKQTAPAAPALPERAEIVRMLEASWAADRRIESTEIDWHLKRLREITGEEYASDVPRPIVRDSLPWAGLTYQVNVPTEDGEIGRIYVTVTGKDGKPLEVFLNGSANHADNAFIARMTSVALRYGVAADEVIDQAWKTRGFATAWGNKDAHRPVTCTANAVAYALQRYVEAAESERAKPDDGAPAGELGTLPTPVDLEGEFPVETLPIDEQPPQLGAAICPKCGSPSLVREEGCQQCHNPDCNFSKCG